MAQIHDQIAKLADAGKKLNDVNGFADLYDATFDLIEDIFGKKDAAMFLQNDKDEKLFLAATRGLGPQAVKQFRTEPGQGIVGHVALTGEPQLVTDTVDESQGKQVGAESISEMAVPLHAGGKVTGVLDMQSHEVRFTTYDLSLFMAFGNQVATAIRSLQLQRNQKDRAMKLVAISKAGQALNSSQNLDDLFDHILKSTNDALSLDTCSIQLWDSNKANLVVTAAIGYEHEVVGLVIPRGKGVTGKAADENRSSIIPDITKIKDPTPALKGCRSEMAVPLVFQDDVIGVLNAEHIEPNQFDETDLLYATIFADYVAGAIGNMRIREDFARAEKEVSQLEYKLDLLDAADFQRPPSSPDPQK